MALSGIITCLFVVLLRGSCRPSSVLKDPALVVAANKHLIEISFDTVQSSQRIVSNVTGKAVAIDFDFKQRHIMVTDVVRRQIIRTGMDEHKTSLQTIVNYTYSDGLAFDWIYGNLYWTSLIDKKFMVKKITGGPAKTLFSSAIDKPRAIALVPHKGLMFWSDWGLQPKIERVGMDGSQRHVIVSTNVVWPNGLTIDYRSNKLYWIDGSRNYIGMCNFDGSQRETLLQSSLLSRAFELSIYKGLLYWTARGQRSIYRVTTSRDRNSNTDGVTKIARIYASDLLGIKVFHQDCQPTGTNYCAINNGGCSHLCLPAPQLTSSSPKITCACYDGSYLMPGGKTCNNTEINHCSRNPCKNGGTCTNKAGGYDCTCTSGYTGTNCTIGEDKGSYDCSIDRNPCSPLAVVGTFYYPHVIKSKFVQCSAHGQCYTRSCPSSLQWNPDKNACT